MRILLVAALGLGAFTSPALAEPVALNDAQMDSLTAGFTINQFNSATVEVKQSNSSTVDVRQSSSSAVEINQDEINQSNSATVEVNQSNSATIDVNQSNSAGVTTAGTYAASQGSSSVTVN
jgi:hypothetical protein